MIRHPTGENNISSLLHSPLIIPCVPVTFANINVEGTWQRISSVHKTPIQGLLKKLLFKDASNDQFRWRKVYDLS